MLSWSVHRHSGEGHLWQVMIRGEVKHGMLTFRMCCVLPVTAQCLLKANLKQGWAIQWSLYLASSSIFYWLSGNSGISTPSLAAWIKVSIHSTVWVVLEKQLHPVRLYHSHAISLKCPSILLLQFNTDELESLKQVHPFTHQSKFV